MTMGFLTDLLAHIPYIPSPPRGVWHLGSVPIRAYALCIIVGIVVALLIGDRRWRARGGEPGVIYDVALWAVPFGLVGGRLYHLMTDWKTYFGDAGAGLDATLRIWDGGLGIWGAVALGAVGAWIGCRRHGIPLPAFGDAIAPGIILAQAIGRLGNYFNQELYGRETTLPWGLQIFWREDSAGVRDPHLLDGVSTGELYKIVQPTFLYELLWNVLIFAVLIYLDRRFRIGHGRLFALYVAGYCLGRFGIELLRDDAATHIAGIRVNSFTSMFVFIGAVVYIILAPKGREDPVMLRSTWQTDENAVEPTPEPEKELVAVASGSDTAGAGAVADEDGAAATASTEVDSEPPASSETNAATEVPEVEEAAVEEPEEPEADEEAEEPEEPEEAEEPEEPEADEEPEEPEEPEEAEEPEEPEEPEADEEPEEPEEAEEPEEPEEAEEPEEPEEPEDPELDEEADEEPEEEPGEAATDSAHTDRTPEQEPADAEEATAAGDSPKKRGRRWGQRKK